MTDDKRSPIGHVDVPNGKVAIYPTNCRIVKKLFKFYFV